MLVAAGGVLAAKGVVLPLESSAAVMHPQPNPPLEAEERIGREFGGGESPLILHLAASSPDRLLRLAWSVEARVGSVKEIRGEFGLESLLPDPVVAERRMAEWRPAMAEQTVADFDRALAETSFNPAAFARYRNLLKSLLTAARSPTVADLCTYRQLGADDSAARSAERIAGNRGADAGFSSAGTGRGGSRACCERTASGDGGASRASRSQE